MARLVYRKRDCGCPAKGVDHHLNDEVCGEPLAMHHWSGSFTPMRLTMPSYIYHILVWLLVIVVTTFFKLQDAEYPAYLVIIGDISSKALYAVLFYTHYFFLIPRYLKPGWYGRYIPAALLTMALFPLLAAGHDAVYAYGIPVVEADQLTLSYYLTYFLGPVIYIIPAIAIRYAVDGLQSSRQAQALAREKREAEMGLLKAQVNPHFLFNAFNSLYALSLDSDKRLPDTILKMADLMAYTLDASQKEQLRLTEEVKLVKDYLEIQKLRLDEEFDLRFHQRGDLTDKTVMPLILLPIVENCFKHGDLSDEGFIHLDLQVSESRLIFRAQNTIDGDGRQTGNGLANLRRRLELQCPPDFELTAAEDGDVYTSYLAMPFLCESHVP